MVGIKLENGKLDVIEIDDKNQYEEIVKIVGSPFDIARRKFKDSYVDIYCDDEFLFKSDLVCSAFCDNANEMLGGTLLILNNDDMGNSISLTNIQVNDILNSVCKIKKDFVLKYDTSIGVVDMKFREDDLVLKYSV